MAVSMTDPGPITQELATPEEPLYEVVGGQRVELPPMGAFPTQLASDIQFFLGRFVREHDLGRVNVEMLYRIDAENRLERRPDVAFVSYSRWPKDRPVPEDAAWDVIPDLAVEVVSPSDRAEDLMEKVGQYVEAGVGRVWVVYPRSRVVHRFEGFDRVLVIPRGGTIAEEPLLPGFRLDLNDLFEDRPAPGR